MLPSRSPCSRLDPTSEPLHAEAGASVAVMEMRSRPCRTPLAARCIITMSRESPLHSRHWCVAEHAVSSTRHGAAAVQLESQRGNQIHDYLRNSVLNTDVARGFAMTETAFACSHMHIVPEV